MSDADIRALREEIDRLQQRVDEMSATQVPAKAADNEDTNLGRRGLFRTVGAAAAGVAVGSLAFAKPAGATDGNAIIIGNAAQTAESPTALVRNSVGYTATPSVGVFHVTDDISNIGGGLGLASCISAIATGSGSSVAFAGGGSTIGAKLDGPVPLKLTDSTNSAAPTSAAGTVGQFKQVDGDLWFCSKSETGAGNDAVWRRLTGVAVAGGFVAIDPARAYDSRQGAYTPNGLMSPNSNRVISVKDAHDAAGAVSVANVVPAGATAVTFNVTVTGTTGPNFLSVVPGAAASFTTSTLNWSTADTSIANGGVCKLDASRQLKVFLGDQSGSTHVILDITGYYL